uniref:2-oxo-4-hydroxy-4-carboxy-5-ureidoimidazoline decarboxylase n=1 Tax=Knipowitschia caucasica TaxID=637954 RepID=A0AAV2LC91_KNICA
MSALEAAFQEFIDALPDSGKEGILRCHPDLAGRDLHRGTLTPESHEEQGGAGLDSLDPSEASLMAQLNQRYKRRFGFPFIICAKMNDKGSILQQLKERVNKDHAEERAHGIEEVKKICHLRLQALTVHKL